MRRFSYGITDFRLRLYWDQFKIIRIALPPYEEAKTILTRIEIESRRIDALMEKTQQSIDLLKEKRAALITAAVTGKIDVRDYG